MPDTDSSIAETVKVVKASPQTRAVIEVLCRHALRSPGVPVPPYEIVRQVWGADYLATDYTSNLWAHISMARDALVAPSRIVTERGRGYWLATSPATAEPPPTFDNKSCKRGHQRSQANTGSRADGSRYCRVCNRERLREKRYAERGGL
jgi:DNA-binding winged helix-turn-helix (wHTH) protein